MRKYLVSSSTFAFLLLFVAAPAFAAEVDVSGENVQTGADSDNENVFDIKEKSKVKVKNDGDVTNKAKGAANTGGNEQDQNTEAGDMDTGGIDVSTDWETVINDGVGITGLGDGLEVDADFLNDTTGFNSENLNELTVKHKPKLSLRNTADVLNRLGLKANSGLNDQNQNTTAGDMSTGDITGDIEISNWANIDSGMSVSGSTSVDVSGDNSTTGANSDNENTVDVKNSTKVKVKNNADLETKVKAHLNTGKNVQNQNTTGGDVDTGDIDVSTDITNVANSGSSIQSTQGTSVSGDFSNDTTGANSKNDNTINVENKSNVKATNEAEVDNKVKSKANTGKNSQSQNTSGGSLSTGDVELNFDMVNVVNSN